MARPASLAVGGYFPTPPRLVPAIASLVELPPRGEGQEKRCVAILDPCAGDGAAVLALTRAALRNDDLGRQNAGGWLSELYLCEAEAGRYDALARNFSGEGPGSYHRSVALKNVLHGDAFQVIWEHGYNYEGVTLLFLNPPYDAEKDHVRLEEKFLARFTLALRAHGILVFVIPRASLPASAATLARCYTDVRCLRFPEPEYQDFGQVVVVARKREVPLLQPDPELLSSIVLWASPDAGMPVLGEDRVAPLSVPETSPYSAGFSNFKLAQIDYHRLLSKVRPWTTSSKTAAPVPVPGILPDPRSSVLVRRYPLAMPPRPAHIAAGIAAGIFNGFRVTPDDPTSGLPDLLVKGVFDREYRTVDEKHNKDGEKTGEVQVQQPKLVTTVLDLSTYQYATLDASPDVTDATDVSDMTTADLIDRYGRGLMEVMLSQCPVMHDPARPEDEIPMAPLARKMFKAQGHAAQAAVKLLGGLGVTAKRRRGKAAFVLGEIGSGKTTVALAVGQTIKARKTLVLCPPHLLDGWRDQIAAVVPEAEVVVLQTVSDVQALASQRGRVSATRQLGITSLYGETRPIIALMSREAAKLGHAQATVTGACPKCGGDLPDGDLARSRARCTLRPLIADEVGKVALELARRLVPLYPQRPEVRQLLTQRPLRRAAARLEKKPLPHATVDVVPVIYKLIPYLLDEDVQKAVERLLLSNPVPEIVAASARAAFEVSRQDEQYWGKGHDLRTRAASWLLLMPTDDAAAVAREFDADDPERKSAGLYGVSRTTYEVRIERKRRNLTGDATPCPEFDHISRKAGVTTWDEIPEGPEAVVAALESLTKASKFRHGAECGEHLYEARPEPRRYPLARYVSRRHPDLFDLLVLDEGHEYATDGSAQEKAAHRLASLGIPTLLLTGTVMNGYAESLFTNLWYLSPGFREEFSRDDASTFVDRYGYKKRLVEQTRDGEVIAYGSVTDRVEQRERILGNAPGVLPILLLKHLLPISVTLHKSDLNIDIPPSSESVHEVATSDELRSRYEKVKNALIRQIRLDRFDKELSGALLGSLAELPGYLDLATADTGNTPEGDYEVRYPKSRGGRLIISVPALPANVVLPKEAWLLDAVRSELAAGRNVLVFGWHKVLLPRLARLLRDVAGHEVPILDPAEVPTGKRQAWIDRKVVKPKRRVLVSNPVCIQTGLNNLVHFSTVVWMENPACNPTVKRQADGRVDRVGQLQSTKILFPVYADTIQVPSHSLLLHKVAVSRGTDGLDAEAALRAAGLGDDGGFSSFSVGRQLYEILTNEGVRKAS